jgi:hypothetical protein
MPRTIKLNEFPPHRRGLWKVRAVPYLYKDRWPAAPFGERWRAIKRRMLAPERMAARLAEE